MPSNSCQIDKKFSLSNLAITPYLFWIAVGGFVWLWFSLKSSFTFQPVNPDFFFLQLAFFAFIIAAIAALIVLFIFRRYMKKKSAKIILFLCSLICFIFGILAFMISLNCKFSTHPENNIFILKNKKIESYPAGSDHYLISRYRLVLRPRQDKDRSIEIGVSFHFFQDAEIGDKVSVSTRNGFFWGQYVLDYKKIQHPAVHADRYSAMLLQQVSRALVRQAQLGASCRVQVPAG